MISTSTPSFESVVPVDRRRGRPHELHDQNRKRVEPHSVKPACRSSPALAFGENCGNCRHLDCTGGKKGVARCAMFKKLAGRRGESSTDGIGLQNI